MSIRVIVRPDPIVTPADVPGAAQALIDAVTEMFDGPHGRLGRALGPQTLELQIGSPISRPIWLPCPPVIEIVSVAYLDAARTAHIVDDTAYDFSADGLRVQHGALAGIGWRDQDALRIRYRTGYDGEDVASGGTGPVPERVRQAIIISVQQLMSLDIPDMSLSSETVEGIGQVQYIVSDKAGLVVSSTVDRLLTGFKVPRI